MKLLFKKIYLRTLIITVIKQNMIDQYWKKIKYQPLIKCFKKL